MTKKNSSALTHSQLISVLNYDPATGAVTRRVKSRRDANRDGDAGCVGNNGRRYITIDGKQYIAHRLVWFYAHGQWPENNLAPKDGDYLNLKLENWIEETQAETSRRSKHRANNTSGSRGVHFDKSRSKWLANIVVNYRTKYLGRFDTKEAAIEAYEKARKDFLGSTSGDVVVLTAKRERGVVRARCRHLWRRTLANAGGVTGWASFEEFHAEFGAVEWRNNREIAAVDQTKPIGPGNWQWQETLYSQFDTSTREGRIAYMQAHRQMHPMTYRDGALRKSFGLDLAAYHRMHDAQDGRCAICKKQESTTRNDKSLWLSVDHCHKTGAIRRLLCNPCNKGLGHFLDDPALLRAAAEYIEDCAANPTSVPASHPSTPMQRKEHLYDDDQFS